MQLSETLLDNSVINNNINHTCKKHPKRQFVNVLSAKLGYLMLGLCDAINSNIFKVIMLVEVCKELKIKESQREELVIVFQCHGQWENCPEQLTLVVLGKLSSLVKCLHQLRFVFEGNGKSLNIIGQENGMANQLGKLLLLFLGGKLFLQQCGLK